MLLFVKIFLIIYICITALVLGVDYWMNFVTKIKRFHIGRWNNDIEWIGAVKKRSYKWLKYIPTVRKNDNYQYLLLDILRGEYRNATIQSWQTASLIQGVNQVGDKEGKELIATWKKNNFTEDGAWKKVVDKVDYAMLAYALLKAEEDAITIKPAMDEVIKVLERNICADGMISYSQGKKSNIRFVDTLGMVCPFLTLYGVKFNEQKYIELAYMQLKKFHEFGLLVGSCLPCHAYDVSTKMPLGVYGWGRGTAWYFLALINTWKEMPESLEREQIEKWIFEAAEDYLQYQAVDGGFNTILQGGGQYDSSVTAAMAFFLHNCWRISKKSEYLNASEKCIQKLKSVTMKNGAIDVCQGDTHGIGVFSQVFDIMPFAQGLLLQTLAMRAEV